MRRQGGIRWGLMLLLVIVLGGLAGGGIWWWKERNREYLLRFQPKVGDTMRYFFEMNMSAQGQSMQISFFVTQKVLQVQKDWQIKIESRMESGVMNMGGQSVPMPSMPPQVEIYRPTGKSKRSARVASPIAGFVETGYPEKPVKIGSVWSERQSAQGTAIETECKVVGRERKRNRDTLKIAVTVRDVSNPSSPILMLSGHQWVDLEKGIPVQVDAQLHQVRLPWGQVQNMQGTVKMYIVSGT